MLTYRMTVYAVNTDKGIQYVAEYPALKTCSGSGSTVGEAIDVLQQEAQVHLDALKEFNLPIPESDVFDDPNAYSGKVLLRISKTLHKHMTLRASEEGLSLNAYMAEALSAYTYANRSLFQKRQDPDSLNVHE